MGGDGDWIPLIDRLAMLRRREPLSMGCQLPSEKPARLHHRLRKPSRSGRHAQKIRYRHCRLRQRYFQVLFTAFATISKT